MTEVRWRASHGPMHVVVTVFTRTLPTHTWANCGMLTFTVTEWPAVRDSLPASWAQLITPKHL